MMLRSYCLLPVSLLFAVCVPACSSPATPVPESTASASAADRTIVNLHAFARLYGYVRYFHPSDEARRIDWNKFAVHGAGVVKDAGDRDELESRLDALFAPVAPTVQILAPGERAAELPALAPESTQEPSAELSVVAWQHAGLGLGSQSRSYESRRVGREDKLFAEHAQPGEVVLADIGDGLRCSVPLALWSRDGHTLGDVRAPLADLGAALDRIPDETSADDLDVRLGAVVVAWNVIQHFYPYFDVDDVDWNAVLDRTLADALDDRDARDFLDTMRRFVGSYHDGHARVMHDEVAAKRALLPISVAWVEDALVVDASADQRVRVGDVIATIDGQPTTEWLAAREQMISGSPQRRRLIATWSLLADDRKKSIDFEIVSADGARRTLTLPYRFLKDGVPQPTKPAAIRTLEQGIYYVDLSRAPMSDIAPHLDNIARAPGAIFDLRGYPKGNHEILAHLLPGPETARWMFIPRISRPDRQGIAWESVGWDMTPQAPHIAGKVVFLTDAAAISYAESVMGYVAGQKLGQIVGSPTAGTNGNVNIIELPGGWKQIFTGMKVLQHDGAQLHILGIQPTVPAAPTIAGMRAGRDEVLEKGLSLITAAQGS